MLGAGRGGVQAVPGIRHQPCEIPQPAIVGEIAKGKVGAGIRQRPAQRRQRPNPAQPVLMVEIRSVVAVGGEQAASHTVAIVLQSCCPWGDRRDDVALQIEQILASRKCGAHAARVVDVAVGAAAVDLQNPALGVVAIGVRAVVDYVPGGIVGEAARLIIAVEGVRRLRP